jgi:hypothetical protein
VQPTPLPSTPIPAALEPIATSVGEAEAPADTVSPGLQGVVDQAVADLAGRLAIDQDNIKVIEVETVVWPDGSLGCPQPGMVYTQVQQDGLLIRLRVEGDVYNYHSGGNRPPFLCEEARDDEPVTLVPVPTTQIKKEDLVTGDKLLPKPIDPALESFVNQAKQDLAKRLSIALDQITPVDAEMVVWPDGSLGCPEPGMAFTQVLQEGMRIRLSVGDKVYHYHSGGGRPLFLCENPARSGDGALIPIDPDEIKDGIPWVPVD